MNEHFELSEQLAGDEVAARLARRPWPTTPIRPGIEVSFEFFPTATEAGAESLDSCVARLGALGPKFVSVTYGAGGSTQDRTQKTVDRIRAKTDLEVAGHLTCVGASQAQIDGVIDDYANAGVRRIVALRGDASGCEEAENHADGYADAAALVEGIRNRPDGDQFDISVAAYPEVHPKAVSPRADLDNLKRKLDAGATDAITQFFFQPDVFLRFLDRARAAGITVPIIPGIMPVVNFTKMSTFAKRCGTSIPKWMPDLFAGLDDAPEVHQLVSATVAAEHCRYLAEHGIRDFHIYTMNQPELSLAVCRILGVQPNERSARSAETG